MPLKPPSRFKDIRLITLERDDDLIDIETLIPPEEELFARYCIGILVGGVCGVLLGIGGTLLIQGIWW